MHSYEHLGRTVRLGKGPVKHDDRTLRLARYLRELPPAPPVRRWSTAVTSWPMFMNDLVGDCTCAAAAHMELAWSSNNGSPWRATDKQVLQAYMAVGGYDPEVGESTDNGANMLDLLNYWRRLGIGGKKIDAFVALDVKKREEFKAAINLFGAVYIGLDLPVSAQNQATWKVSVAGTQGDPSPGSWGGHAIAAFDYDDDGQDDDDGLWIATWGGLQKLTWRWLDGYASEAYACLSSNWADADGAPSGFAHDELKADLSAVAS